MRKTLTHILLCVSIISLLSFNSWRKEGKPVRVLVFSKTNGFRHKSIETGKEALIKLGAEQGFKVDTTENADYFVDDSLKNYAAIVFLSTTMNVLNPAQETSFQRYIQAGGGFVGIHAASDTEYSWPWYGKLVGAYFESHPEQQDATIHAKDKNHPATSHLPASWKRFDEWYNYKNINPDIKVLLTLDESTYKGGKNGANHPIAWYHEYDGGRAFYTGLGHTEQSYTEPMFLQHVLGGIKYAIGNNITLDYKKASIQKVPEADRFVKTMLSEGNFVEPTELTVLPNLDLLIAQRRGEIMYFDNIAKKLTEAGALKVYTKTSIPGVNAEEGVLGIAIDPNFKTNGHVFIFYSPSDTSVNRLSRFTIRNKKLEKTSEKIILQFYSQREICCHTGGSIAFGPDGLLYLSTGDNSTPFNVPKQAIVNNGFAPLDNRTGNEQYDSRRTAGNANDLRGKILRIRVKADGTYEIPEGNLFPPASKDAKPEVYVMGSRNPYRISVDQKTGFLYWGDVGPDANADSVARGPRGYDEVNQARRAGNFGWPLFIADNKPYVSYDYKTGKSGIPFSSGNPINDSKNNTGIKQLPPAQPAFIWYPYGSSKEFPDVGEGGRTAMAGPVYHTDLYPKATRYPEYYSGKLIIYDWIRGWFKAVSMAPNGNYLDMEPFISGLAFSNPVDVEVGPDGRLYVLEYGKGWFTKNPDAGVARIDFLVGNRPPKVNQLVIQKTSGLLPYKLVAKVEATDPDKDKLTYVWNLGNGITKTTTVPTLQHTFTKAGTFPVSVRVIDPSKATTKSSVISVTAGNEQPTVNIQVSGNRSFYFPGKAVNYQVTVADKGAAVIKKNIYVTSTYTEGTDMAGASLGHQEIKETYPGQAIMLKSDCKACHTLNTKSIGPSFTQVSTRYQKTDNAIEYLTGKIIKGGAGAWGQIPMPAHTTMEEEDVKKISEWIMSIGNQPSVKPSMPLTGMITPAEGGITADKKTFNLHASYFDLGSAGAKSLTASKSISLSSNIVELSSIKNRKGFARKDSAGVQLLVAPAGKGILNFQAIDLTDITGINLHSLGQGAETEFEIEVRLDGATGRIIGTGELKTDKSGRNVVTRIALQPITDRKNHPITLIFTPVNPGVRRPLLRSVEFISK